MQPARVLLRHLDVGRFDDLAMALATARLSDDERARTASLRHLESRRIHVAVRLLARELLTTLAQTLAGTRVPPEDWRFATDAFGKPAVLGPALGVPLHFNVSKTRGRVAVAVSTDCALGCDIEIVASNGDELALARRYFHVDEVRWLERQPAAEQSVAFLRLWTVKEAYAKARGRGLALGIDRIRVQLEGNDIRVTEPGFANSDWWFREWSIDDCRIALACPREAVVDEGAWVPY